jgi:hypothetical protein
MIHRVPVRSFDRAGTPTFARRQDMRAKALFLMLAILSMGAVSAGARDYDALERSYAPRVWDTVTWRAHLRSTGYAFETINAQGGSLEHFGFYQHFDGSVSNLGRGHLSLRVASRFADDLNVEPRLTNGERLYVGYAQFTAQTAATRARVGRQFIQEGPTNLTLDGAWLKVSPVPPLEMRFFVGARAPASGAYDVGALDEQTAIGTRMLYRFGPRLQAAMSFAYLEQDFLVSAKPVGLELRMMPMKGLRTMARASYETVDQEWDRAELSTQWLHRKDWPVLSLHVLHRRPSIAANSWFSDRFDIENINIVRSSARKINDLGYGAEVEIFGANVDTRESARVSGTFYFPYGNLGYSARIGDSGEESSWIGDVGHSFLPWLHASVGATLSTYTLMEDALAADERDLVTAYGRLRLQLHSGLRLSAEVQSVDSPTYSEDFRLLIGLDVIATSRESSYGLSREGWLQ